MAATQEKPAKTRLIAGPGMLLVWLYGVMVVGAVSRSVVQISTQFDEAPLAYSLSAVAGVVYGFITYSLVRGGETARRAAFVCCAAELVGVLTVGTWTLVDPSAFPDATCGRITAWGTSSSPCCCRSRRCTGSARRVRSRHRRPRAARTCRSDRVDRE